jgi:hypothetical protein
MGESGFALIETIEDVFEQTEIPNEALKGGAFEPVDGEEKPARKRRTASKEE